MLNQLFTESLQVMIIIDKQIMPTNIYAPITAILSNKNIKDYQDGLSSIKDYQDGVSSKIVPDVFSFCYIKVQLCLS